ncbi:MAG: hypothetical protein CMF46_04960 [Legionellales bacterium]|nr:hypothetical protein [Legionellales bacterium]|tara:strand:- start:734 stop:1879 length:1146 start_codon:yes stop_codon:yes gene_type:complete
MAGKQGGEQPEGMEPLYYSCLIIIILVYVWYHYHTEIVRFIILLRYYELKLVLLVVEQLDAFLSQLSLPVIDKSVIINDIRMHQTANPASVHYSELWWFMSSSGIYLVPLNVACSAVFSYYLMFKSKVSKFKSVYTMNVLRKKELENWPHTRISTLKNLVKVGLDDPFWAMSEQPLGFAKSRGLLRRVIRNRRPAVELDRAKAEEVFSLQLGREWTGVACLRDYELALFTVFAAKTNRASEAADGLIRQLAASAMKGRKGLNMAGVNKLLQAHIGSKEVGIAVGPHAYVHTVMASMLEMARTDGVMASSEFLWLKTIDRQLWYVLNNVGRVTSFSEVAGVMAHWKVESKLRRPLRVPCVMPAVDALEEAILDVLYNPDEQD